MTRYINNAEGQPDGTVLTAANSGGKSGVAFTALGGGGSCVFSNTDSVDGTQCYWVNETLNQKYAAWDGLSLTQATMRMYVKFISMPANTQDMMSIVNGPKLQIVTGTNKMRVVPAAGGTNYDFPTALAVNEWHRFELYSKLGGSASTGDIMASHFLGHSQTVLDAALVQMGSGYAGTANYTGLRFMKLTGSVPLNAKFDCFAADTAAVGLLGPSQGTTWWVRQSGIAVRGYPKIRIAGVVNDIIT